MIDRTRTARRSEGHDRIGTADLAAGSTDVPVGGLAAGSTDVPVGDLAAGSTDVPVGGPPRRWPRSFADRLAAPLPGLPQLARLIRASRPLASLGDVDRIPIRRTGLAPLRAGTTTVTWVGHATYVLDVGGLRVLTDPVWSRRIPGVRPRFVPPGVALTDVTPVDAVVISHNHYDHLDAPTIRRLPRDTAVFVPAGLGDWFRRRGFRRVTELDWWESARLHDVRFDFVPAQHWSRRGPADTCRSLWGGWLLGTADGPRIHFAGDTGYGAFFAEIARRYPRIDLALLPIGAYHPRWFLRTVHLDPAAAVRAFLDLGADRMATMHWGTFAMTKEPVLEPWELVHAAWSAAGLPRERLWDLAIGETRQLAT
ncbi:MBL fold metallo-hydrolase [Actinocatenispora comari]|uniref:Membrane protein n=1 Tax=Actinocatenispora comari TaxID=2807577 RepID=A0A8J4AGW8_9ACTN|nr:MBL fold metallo-hydrolase [Actinocatenispora comari]GIL30469.1 membrane protein [Actinocatenispora comari]